MADLSERKRLLSKTDRRTSSSTIELGKSSEFNEESLRRVSAPQVTLSWSNIFAVVKSSPSLKDRIQRKNPQPEKVILRNVSGLAKPRDLIALMGASGAGKTTLLNVLANEAISSLDVKGSVRLNGKEVLGSSLGAIAAYVQQEDLFIGTLTVIEHMRFQAALRMGSKVSKQYREHRVTEVMSEMGLHGCGNTVIGIPGKLKGISGGEKKRLAFASEILNNAPLLFADEPTSGLDSFMAESVVAVLQKIAQSGRTVLCTIHQPSSEVFAMFDQLILLAEGQVAYCGPADSALSFFRNIGYSCPDRFNPADFYIHTLAVAPGKEEKCRENIKSIVQKFETSELGNALKRNIEDRAQEKDDDYPIEMSKKAYKASVFGQLKWVLWRSWLSNIRDKTAARVKIVQSIVIAVLMGLMYLRSPYNQSRVQNIPAALFFALIQLSISTTVAVLQTFPLEMPVFLREHRARLYRTIVFYLSKLTADIPFLVLQAIVFSVIFYFMIGFHSAADRFFVFVGLCILVAMIALSLGKLVSSASPTVSVALAVGPVSLVPFMLFGGFFIRSGTVPVYLVWVQYISWFYFGFELLMVNEWRDTSLSCSPQSATCLPNGTTVLDFYGLEEKHFTRDLAALFGLLAGLQLIAILVLWLRVRLSKK